MNNMKVYISGAITNNPDYEQQFKEAEKYLISLGYAVINPVKNLGFTYKEYIDMALNELMHCDAIYMMKGYKESKGALLELKYAKTIDMEIMYE
jgi:hypothetical protein